MADSNKNLQPIKDILAKINLKEDKYINYEFQDYGCRLAEDLSDLEHKSLYIKLAKETPRRLLEEARNFVKGAYNPKTPGRLFMWKLSELKKTKAATQKSVDKKQ